LVFFFVALCSNKFFGLPGFIVVLVLEFVFLYFFGKYYSEKQGKRKADVLKNEKKELQQIKKASNKDKKKNFVLRL